jgi:hypothetical protein
MVCGVNPNVINWNGNNWAFACDFVNHDLSNSSKIASQCGPLCDSTVSCTHFTWTNYNGGTCFLKSGRILKSDAYFTNDYSMVCGVNPNIINLSTPTITTTQTTTTTSTTRSSLTTITSVTFTLASLMTSLSAYPCRYVGTLATFYDANCRFGGSGNYDFEFLVQGLY